MSDGSKIEWTDATWNPVTGCSVVSPGCTNCYAMSLAGTRLRGHSSRQGLTRDTKAGPVWTGEVRFNRQWLDQPLRWRRSRMIFVCAHGDLFHESVPDAWVDQVFAVMALTPQHTYQVLTKRSARMREFMARSAGRIADRVMELRRSDLAMRNGMGPSVVVPLPHIRPGMEWWPLPNVWLGVSAERQQEADARIPDLLATPAAVRFISAEPLLGPTDLTRLNDGPAPGTINALSGDAYDGRGVQFPVKPFPRLNWIIVGGESGPNARPMHPDWARSIRDQCTAAGIPFFFKQWGEWEIACDANGRRNGYAVHRMPDTGEKFRWLGYDGRTANPSSHDVGQPAYAIAKVGKAKAGRLLDGREWSEMPGQAAPALEAVP